MANVLPNEEIQLDIKELELLLGQASRPGVKSFLQKELERLGKCEEVVTKKDVVEPQPLLKSSVPTKYYKDILNYAWDQSDNFMKIYVTVNGVHKVPKENIVTEFTPKSFLLKVHDVESQNFKCHLAYLWESIVPEESYSKVKTDTVLLMLKKEKVCKTWAYVTQKEDNKKSPKFDEKKDPNESLMDLMKKMYDEGDEEMKRMIAKSFSDSRNKAAGGDF